MVIMKGEENNKKRVDSLYVQAILIAEVVKRILWKKAEVQLSSEPIVRRVPIIDFMRKMRVWGLEKFEEEKVYISAVNFYRDSKDYENHRAVGALVLYIRETYIVKLFREMGYPILDENDESSLMDACGTFCNLVAAKFNSGLIQLNYRELIMSHFMNYIDEIGPGVDYDVREKEKYEVSFEISGEKRMAVDLTMGDIPRDEN